MDLNQNRSFGPVINTSTLAGSIPDPVKDEEVTVPDQGVGLSGVSAMTLLGLCAGAGYRSRRQTA